MLTLSFTATSTIPPISEQEERMKTNIVDAPSYYNTIKNIGIKKFNYKSEPEGSPLKVGVIAQQVETVEANLVDDEFAVDGNPNEESTTKMKAVHEEQLFMMGIKALQELSDESIKVFCN